MFDPRSSRDHIAAILCSGTSPAHLPRSEQYGTVALFDVLRQRVICRSHVTACSSRHLQYACAGQQVMTSSFDDDCHNVGVVADSEVTSYRRPTILLMSADNLDVLQRLPVTSSSITSAVHDGTVAVYSVDLRHVILVWNNPNRNSRDYSSSRKITAQTDHDHSGNKPNDVARLRHELRCADSLEVATFRLPAACVRSLSFFASVAILKVVPRARINAIPLPYLLKAELLKIHRLW